MQYANNCGILISNPGPAAGAPRVLTGSKRTWTENEALGAEGDDHE
ncbi:hypothetical protein ACVWZ8_004888 [Arthrobacter sp. UYCu723]